MAAHLEAWRGWEPWSLHWLTNEEVEVDGDRAEGTWLWSSASATADGPEWAGGDLRARAERTPDGWRLSHLELTDRYRTPLPDGWLTCLRLGPSVDGAEVEPGPGRTADDTLVTPPPPGPDGPGASALLGEHQARRLVAGVIADLEDGVDPAALVAARWAASGALVLVDPAGRRTAQGPTSITELVAADVAEGPVVLRVLTSEHLEVAGAAATGRWRDLWVAERQGRAVWLAHRYELEASEGADGWRIDRLVRHELLRADYEQGWAA